MTRRVALCDWALCLQCGTSHRLPVLRLPSCCQEPLVMSLYTLEPVEPVPAAEEPAVV